MSKKSQPQTPAAESPAAPPVQAKDEPENRVWEVTCGVLPRIYVNAPTREAAIEHYKIVMELSDARHAPVAVPAQRPEY